MDQKPSHEKSRQAEWRERIPEIRRIVENVAPAMWNEALAGGVDRVPDAWRALVADMQQQVHAPAEEWQRDRKKDQLYWYRWSLIVGRVGNMLEYLMRAIRVDLGFREDKETMAQMLLVEKAMVQLEIALQNGGSTDGRDDADEHESARVPCPAVPHVMIRRRTHEAVPRAAGRRQGRETYTPAG